MKDLIAVTGFLLIAIYLRIAYGTYHDPFFAGVMKVGASIMFGLGTWHLLKALSRNGEG